MKRALLLGLLLTPLFICPVVTRAQWQLDGAAVSTATDNQVLPTIASDGAGGAIITWGDSRNGNSDIYAQRIDPSGAVQWTANGVALCTAASDQANSMIVTDGTGGAIVTWEDLRNGNYDIYAQRIDASGAVQWTADGVALCTASSHQRYPVIVGDGAGGAVVSWEDLRNGNYDIYAQRIDASGAVQWATDGVAACTAGSGQYNVRIASDGTGGAIVTWDDLRSTTFNHIYAQRIDASGAVVWTTNGVALCTAANGQYVPAIIPDGAGGAIVAWQDFRSLHYDIYAQRVNASGVVLWTTDGVPVSTDDPSHQDYPTIVSDGAGGAIITWQDSRNLAPDGWDIYAQRVNTNGTALWTTDGVALCNAPGDQQYPIIVSDGAGGAAVTWYDHRNGTDNDVYAQRVDASGMVQWTTDGLALCTAVGDQVSPTLVSDGIGGATVTWQDSRGGDDDIYAQRIEGSGDWYAAPVLVSVKDVPGDQGGHVKVNWLASGYDVAGQRIITRYSVWRATDAAAAANAMKQGTAVRGPSDVPGDFQGTAVWTQHANGTDYFWEWLANIDAHYFSAYSYTASTGSDSTSVSSYDESYLVSAHTGDPFVFFDSNVMSGHSVDNLAPPAPLYLTAQRVAGDVQLHWRAVNVSDLRDYAVYRATSSGVTPVPINFLSNEPDTIYVDADAPTSTLHYIVTAYDVHENQSVPSNEAVVSGATTVGDTPPVTTLVMLQNVPNPFATSTRLEIGLPSAAAVQIELYDVTGRRVRTMKVAGVKGWQAVTFASLGDDGAPLVSGVYFCRIRSSGVTVTRKMVIAR
ncbi:MAG TPA: T9SS type A sorting domain-containing protein [Candidatus Krumholzibacteria bacterium]|nr:T9SS type A sorting domain-containing protein [Candidatus Krumholzibacteria bacterium]